MIYKKPKILYCLLFIVSLFGAKTALACEEVSQDSSGNLWCYSNCTWDVERGIRKCDVSTISLEKSSSSEDQYATLDSLSTAVSEGTYVGTPLQLEKQMLAATATVNQKSCSKQADVSFDKLSSAERILIRSAADAFVYGETGPKELGCSLYDDGGGECSAFGYVCWVDSDGSGCAKETC